MSSTDKPTTIDAYIARYPEPVQAILQGIRQTIQRTVPEATETMSYDMPTFDLHGHHLIYFSAWKDHIGMYPLYSGGGELKELLEPYRQEKNSVHLPYDDPFPYDLVAQFVRHRVAEESSK